MTTGGNRLSGLQDYGLRSFNVGAIVNQTCRMIRDGIVAGELFHRDLAYTTSLVSTHAPDEAQ